jgi:hypothetical protein
MNSSSVRRRGHAALGSVVALSVTAVLAAPMLAAPASAQAPAAASSATSWLATQLTNGVVHNDQWDFDDYGLTADIALSMDQVGGDAAMVRQIRRSMASHVGAYTTGGDPATTTERYSGAVAKSLVLAQVTGADPRNYGGLDLVAQAEGLVTAGGPSAGRLADVSEYGDYANTFGQALAARGLANAGSPKAGEVTDFLLLQQCSSGYFRTFFTTDPQAAEQGCVEGDAESSADTDATATALIHLSAIRQPSDSVRGAIARGATWLATNQAADGSFGGGVSTPEVNANSTGLAAGALGVAGQCRAAGRAAEWVGGLQVTASSPAPLRGEEGAIAYDRAAFDAGAAGGIAASRDQWRRTTAQAAGGLAYRLGVTSGVSFGAPAEAAPGDTVAITASGLTPGDRFCLEGPGVDGSRSVVVTSDGELRTRVALPASLGTAGYTLHGRDGAGTVTVNVRSSQRLSSVAGVELVAPDGFQRAGSSLRLSVKGARGGDRFLLGGVQASGPIEVVTGSDGVLDRVVTLPWATSKVSFTLTGQDGESVASVQVLGQAKLKVKAPKTVRRGKKARLVVRGLVAGERVVVRIGHRKVASGTANASGRFVRKVKVKARRGRTKVAVVGQFPHRKGQTRIRVK